MMDIIDTLKLWHQRIFTHYNKLWGFFAPGRINLIGEHVDYNGGLVMPCAIEMGIYAVVSDSNDKIIKIYSKNFDEKTAITFNLDHSIVKGESYEQWGDYVKGVFKLLLAQGYTLPHGLNITISSNLPVGAGLSSSAALEILIIEICNVIYNLNISKPKIAQIGRQVENEYVGVKCGIMDQFAVINGEVNSAMLLNCNTLEYKHIPLHLYDYIIVITNSNKKRSLNTSIYNDLVSDCNSALKQLQGVLNIKYLCDIDITTFNQHAHLITNPIHRQMAKHAVTENARTLSMVNALENHQIHEVGKILTQSHLSLKNDYSVSCDELDCLVDNANLEAYCVGSRMIGAGFGGCTISIIEKKYLKQFITTVSHKYTQQTGLTADFYTTFPHRGAHQLTLQ